MLHMTVIAEQMFSDICNDSDQEQSLMDLVVPRLNQKMDRTQFYDAIYQTLVDHVLEHPGYLKIAAQVQCRRMYAEFLDAYPTLKAYMVEQDQPADGYNYFVSVNTMSYYQELILQAYAEEVTNPVNRFSAAFQEAIREIADNPELVRIDMQADKLLSNMGAKQMHDRYLERRDNQIIEIPQLVWLRVAVGTHLNELMDPDLSHGAWANIYNAYAGISKFDYLHSTATAFNAGHIQPQLSSCFKIHVPDSTQGITDAIGEASSISSGAGGLSLDFSSVRGKGAKIKTRGGTSSGTMPFMRMFQAALAAFNQGGRRPGSGCIYEVMHHIDILGFLDAKKEAGDHRQRLPDVNTALWIPDLFMERVDAKAEWSLFSPDETPLLSETYGEAYREAYLAYEELGKAGKLHLYTTINADTLFKRVMNALFTTGHPWPCFKDTSNFRYANGHCGIVRSSNLCCMTADQRVVTDRGLLTVGELYQLGGTNKVVGLDGVYQASEMLLPRPDAPIVQIETKEGYTHKVTPDHKVWVKDRGWVEAQHLVAGDKLLIQQLEGLWGTEHNPELGYFLGISTHTSASKVHTHIWTSDRKTVIAYLNGLYVHSTTPLVYQSTQLRFIQDLQLLWANFGIKTSIIESQPDGFALTVYQLVMSDADGHTKAQNILQGTDTQEGRDNINEGAHTTFTGLTTLPNEDAYCLTVESDTHAWTVNGLVTKNTEIILHTNEEETAVCNLASVNLANMIRRQGTKGVIDYDRLRATVRTAIRSLDNVIDVNHYTDSKTRYANQNNRPLGLGCMGFHTMMMNLGIPLTSPEALQLVHELHYAIELYATEMSVELAEERGVYPNYQGSTWSKGMMIHDTLQLAKDQRADKGVHMPTAIYKPEEDGIRAKLVKHGIRNGQLLAIAPTASISNFPGVTQSIEPIYEYVYTRANLSGEFTVLHNELTELLIAKGLWTKANIDQIIKTQSIRHLGLSPEDIEVYKTFFDIPVETLIDLNAARQVYIDQSISLNIPVPGNDGKRMYSAYVRAWERGLKTTYYVRSLSAGAAEPTVRIETNPIDKQLGKACAIDNPDCEACQ